MLNELKRQVLAANLSLPAYGLVTFTGQRLGDRPPERAGGDQVSGIAYEAMTLEDLVVVDLEGKVREGHRKPSSDTATHWRCTAPSPILAAWCTPTAATPPSGRRPGSRSRRWAPPTPTTFTATFLHPADERGGDRRRLRGETGKVIIETFNRAGRDPQQVPGVLVYSHGPFAGARTRRMRCTTRWCWKRWRSWQWRRASWRRPSPRCSRSYWINISCASTANTPTTGNSARQRFNSEPVKNSLRTGNSPRGLLMALNSSSAAISPVSAYRDTPRNVQAVAPRAAVRLSRRTSLAHKAPSRGRWRWRPA